MIHLMRLCTLICLVALAIPQTTAAPAFTQKDRDAGVKYLEETRKNFLDSINGLSEAQWTFKAGPDRWSIAETAEHITVSEGFIVQLISEKILKGPKAAAEDRADPRREDHCCDYRSLRQGAGSGSPEANPPVRHA